MAVDAAAPPAAIDTTLRDLAGAHMAHGLELSRDARLFSMTHFWRHLVPAAAATAGGRCPLRQARADLRAGRPCIVDDAAALPDHLPVNASLEQHGIGALLTAPIQVGGRIAGTFGLSRRWPHTWTRDERLLLRFACTAVHGIVHNHGGALLVDTVDTARRSQCFCQRC